LIDIDTIILDNEEYSISVITYMEVLGYAIICATAISENAYLLTNDAHLKTIKKLKVKTF